MAGTIKNRVIHKVKYKGVMDIWQAENLSGFSNGHLVGWLFQPTFCIYEPIYKLLFVSFIQSIMIMQCSFKL